MKRSLAILFLLLTVTFGIWLATRPKPEKPPPTVASPASNASGIKVTETSIGSRPSPHQPPQMVGEQILRDYARTNLPPQNDLTLMSQLMENSVLLLKAAANRPLSANEDWADFLRGRNPAHERFLPDSHLALNGKGQLIDRWGTPLFFHALGNKRYEIRSAGPDKALWTEDDIHRNADGSFRRGAELNPPTLAPR